MRCRRSVELWMTINDIVHVGLVTSGPVIVCLVCAAAAPQCRRGVRGGEDSAPAGGLAASGPAGVSTELRGRCHQQRLPNSATLRHHRLGELCETHRS